MQVRTRHDWNSYARGRRGTLNLSIPRGKFPKRMRHGLWSECARHATDIENILVTENKKELGPSYKQFYGSERG